MNPSQTRPPVVLQRKEHPLSRSLIDSDALWIMRKLQREGKKALLVGGAVRDILLGRTPKDFDIGTCAPPSLLKKIFKNARLVGKRFRIAHVYFRQKSGGDKIIEVTTFRGPRPIDDNHNLHPDDVDLTGCAFGTPEEDVWRRDFTVNALYYDPDDYTIVDLTGGLADLEARLIRLIGEPDDRFSDDPVRMLRAIEFAVRLGFSIEPGTEEGIKRNAGLIVEASEARLREEFRQMQERGIMGEVLRRAKELNLFAHLFPHLECDVGLYELLARLDAQTLEGQKTPEYLYITALALPSVIKAIPLTPSANLEAVNQKTLTVTSHITEHYKISSHIRHDSHELIMSFYKLAKMRAYKYRGKFTKKSGFIFALDMFATWSQIHGGAFDEAVEYWKVYMAERDKPREQSKDKPEGRKRPRRRRPRRVSSPKPA